MVFIIFGATGDLMARKLMPAIYGLYKRKEISQNLFLVGVGRREMTNDQFRELMANAVLNSHALRSQKNLDPSSVSLSTDHNRDAHEKEKPDQIFSLPARSTQASFDQKTWERLIDGVYYEQGFFEDPTLYDRLVATLARFDETMKACVPRFFYLATPPEHYEPILTHLKTSTLSEGCGQGTTNFTRVLIEKPFGRDLETARKLDRLLAGTFEEKQIYRIDHYLGKETVQNILSLRFANGIFEPTWNRDFIDHVQITLAETEGVGNRGAFYDGVGAIRDVVQNHIIQMMALIAMEQPKAFDATSIRDMRSAAIKAVKMISPKDLHECVLRGQYDGYTKEKNVDPASRTETFVALKLELDAPRWKGVPFYLRTGKKLQTKTTEISIHYKKPVVCTGPACLFNEPEVKRNTLAIRIEPDEGVSLRLMVKNPKGGGMSVAPVVMRFSYAKSFPGLAQPDPYEKLLLDAIIGDATLFARTDGIEASWQFVTNILSGLAAGKTPLVSYKPGSMGPKVADAFIEKDGRHWFLQENPL